MNYKIDKTSKKTAYIQLYEQIKKDITDGVYTYGAKLPSKRTLAEETGISVIPVEHAYFLLCDEGYAESRERSGFFVIYKKSDFFTGYDGGDEIPTEREFHGVKSSIPFSVIAKKMRKVLSDKGERILQKSPDKGCIELRTAISSYLARSSGIQVKPEQVVVGSGAEYLYSMISQLLGKNVFAIEDPSYEKISAVYKANGVRFEMLKMGKNGIKSRELEKTKATVLHVTPFNSYPSGISADASKKREYLSWAKEKNGYIIEDNYDSELTVSKKNDDTLFALSNRKSVIYLNTFSNTVAPSIRTGYMLLPEDLLQTFNEQLGFYSCTVPIFEQYVLSELISSGDFERHINRIRRIKRKSEK